MDYCNFNKKMLVDLSITAEELVLLNYIIFKIDNGSSSLMINGRDYYKISYKDMFVDLPILRKKERQTRRLLVDLENKELITRYHKNNNTLFIYVNQELLYFGIGNKKNNVMSTQSDLQIIILDRNIKIYSKSYNFSYINKFDLVNMIQDEMRDIMNDEDYDRCFGYSEVNYSSDNMISFSINNGDILNYSYSSKLQNCIENCINDMTT